MTATEPALCTNAPITGPSAPVIASVTATKFKCIEKARLKCIFRSIDRNVTADTAHCDTDIRLFKCRSIVYAVTDHAHRSALCKADFAAFICKRISSQGTSSSIILSIA